MKFLFLLPHPLLPTDRGNKHHTLNLLRRLTREHECDVIGFNEGRGTDDSSWRRLEAMLPGLEVLDTFEQNSGNHLRIEGARCLLAGLPAVLARYRNDRLRQKLEEIHERYDLVCFDMYTMVEHQRACQNRPSVLIASDAYSLMLLRAVAELREPSRCARTFGEALLQARLERTYYPRFDAVTTVSNASADWLKRVSPRALFDTVEVPASEELLASTAQAHPSAGPPTVLCWEMVENDAIARSVARFVEKSWPAVVQQFPEAELVIWGRRPHAILTRVLRNARNVRLVDFVDDWLTMLRSGSVFLFPHRCTAGMHLKLLSAMAVGLPVVAAPESCGWATLTQGEHVFVCKSDEEYTGACLTLLGNPALRDRVGAAARHLIEQGFTSDVLGEKMLGVFKGAIERHHRRRADATGVDLSGLARRAGAPTGR